MKTLSHYQLNSLHPISSDIASYPYHNLANSSAIRVEGPKHFMRRLLLLIEARMDDPELRLSQVAQTLHVSTMQLYRKVKRFSGLSPNQFIRTIRLHRGRHLLLSTDLNVAEVAYAVGFNDPNYFTRSFTHEFKLSPTRYRSQH